MITKTRKDEDTRRRQGYGEASERVFRQDLQDRTDKNTDRLKVAWRSYLGWKQASFFLSVKLPKRLELSHEGLPALVREEL